MNDLLDGDGALALELEGNRTSGAQGAASMAEGRTDIGSGAVLVVGQAVNVHGDTSGAIALIGDLGVVGCIRTRTKGLLDSSVNLVLGHGVHAGLLDGRSKGEVVFGVGVATRTSGNSDDARELREKRRALCILRKLTMLGGGPLGVSGHACSFLPDSIDQGVFRRHENSKTHQT